MDEALLKLQQQSATQTATIEQLLARIASLEQELADTNELLNKSQIENEKLKEQLHEQQSNDIAISDDGGNWIQGMLHSLETSIVYNCKCMLY